MMLPSLPFVKDGNQILCERFKRSLSSEDIQGSYKTVFTFTHKTKIDRHLCWNNAKRDSDSNVLFDYLES